jgi:hypothetical protein
MNVRLHMCERIKKIIALPADIPDAKRRVWVPSEGSADPEQLN